MMMIMMGSSPCSFRSDARLRQGPGEDDAVGHEAALVLWVGVVCPSAGCLAKG